LFSKRKRLRELRENFGAEWESLEDNLRQQGYKILHVHTDITGFISAHSYTVGLINKFKHPELILFGVDPATSENILEQLICQIKKLNHIKEFTVFETESGQEVSFIRSTSSVIGMYMALAKQYCELRQQPLQTTQVVITDQWGYFPWEPEYDKQYFRKQPMTGRYKPEWMQNPSHGQQRYSNDTLPSEPDANAFTQRN